MAHNEETIGMNGQKDLASPPIKAFDKEKLLAMQKQRVEGMCNTLKFITLEVGEKK